MMSDSYKHILAFDLDGTIRHNPDGEFINGPDDIALYDGVCEALLVYRSQGWTIFGVTNQGGVAYGHKTPGEWFQEKARMKQLWTEDWPFEKIYAAFAMKGGDDPYDYDSLLRKRSYGMLALAEKHCIDEGYGVRWDESFMIGDSDADKRCAKDAGISYVDARDWRDRMLTPQDPFYNE